MDEQLKQQLMPAIVVFNTTVVLYVLVRLIYPIMQGQIITMNRLLFEALIGAAIGLVTGGITLAVMMRKK
jgi:hypothetical protein